MAIGGISWPRKPDPCSLRQDWGGRSTDLDATSLRGNEVRHVTRQRPHPLPLRGGALATSRGRGEAAAPLRGTQNASWGGVCRSPSLQGGGASEKGVPALKRGGPAGGGVSFPTLTAPFSQELGSGKGWEAQGNAGASGVVRQARVSAAQEEVLVGWRQQRLGNPHFSISLHTKLCNFLLKTSCPLSA